MAHRASIVCLTLFLSSCVLLCQQEESPWLSLGRLTLTASGSYHYAPWKKYNESLLLVQEAVQYNPAYPFPGGTLEKVKGDLTYEIEASYRVISSLAVTLTAGWLQTESVLDFRNESPTARTDDRQPYWQTMWLSSVHFGAGVSYTYKVDDLLSLSAGTSVVQYPTRLDFQAASQIPMIANIFTANLVESAPGVHAHLLLELKAFGPISIVSRIEYRWLTLKNLRGSGSETDMYFYPPETQISGPRAFEAQLGEADGYFGLIISPTDAPINSYLLHRLWARTPAGQWWNIQQPASLDLSGFGLSLGVSYAF